MGPRRLFPDLFLSSALWRCTSSCLTFAEKKVLYCPYDRRLSLNPIILALAQPATDCPASCRISRHSIHHTHYLGGWFSYSQTGVSRETKKLPIFSVAPASIGDAIVALLQSITKKESKKIVQYNHHENQPHKQVVAQTSTATQTALPLFPLP
ncbi:hypothetical protein VTI28DRAFT_2882 [Corynascus sepedonium]